MMKWTSTITALSLSMISASAFSANDEKFQNELTISYMDLSSSSIDVEPTWSAQYTYFGSHISQKTSPYQLNRFISQTSTLDLNYSNTDGDSSYGIGGEYVFDSKWFIGGDYQRADYSLFGDTDVYNANFGYYINDFTKVYFAASKSEEDTSLAQLDGYQYDIGLKTFIRTAYGEGVYVTADYTYNDSEVKTVLGTVKSNSKGWGIKADYYFTKSFSLGGSYSDSTFENSDDTYAVSADYFLRIVDNVSIEFSADKVIEPSEQGFSYHVSLIGRF